MFFKRILILPFCLFHLTLFSQIKIGNNPTSINFNSVLELEATNKGLLLPRVALSATNNFSPLSAFVAGMTVYNTATAGSSPNNVVPGFYYCNGTKWVKIGDEVGASKWTNVPASSRVQLTNLSDGTTARSTSAQFVITDLGRVAIGATVPIAKLDVISNPTFDFSYGIRVNGTGGFSGTTHKTFAVTTNDTDRAVFYGDGRVLLGHNGGNIGIGTGSPREKLDVDGNVRFSGALMPDSLPGTTGQVLTSAGAGNPPTWTDVSSLSTNNIYNIDGTLTGNRIVTQGASTLAFTSTATNGFSVDGTTLSVDAANNRIGVGTALPTSALDVRGYAVFTDGISGIAIGQAGYADIHALGTNRLTLNYDLDTPTDINFESDSSVTIVTGGDGKLGVGVLYPTEKLDLLGNLKLSGAFMPNNLPGTSGQILTSAGAGTAPTWSDISSLAANNIYNTNGTLTGNRTVTQGASTLAFTSSATNGFSVDGTTFSVDAANNRIGLSTAAPNYRLSLGSDVANTKLAIWDGGSGTSFGLGVQANQFRFNINQNADRFSFLNSEVGTEVMTIRGSGNVGVGVTTPSEKLQVEGNVRFSGALMPNNLAGSAGQVLISAGTGTAPTWTDVSSLAANNIYNTNGTLSGNRTVTQGASTLAFTSSATNGFSVDGTTFSVDAANNRIGIGTATPARALDVFGASMAVTNSGDRGVTIAHSYTNAAATASTLQLAKSRGTFASPTDIQSGDDMGRIEFRAIAYRAQGGALIIGQASENQTSTANGTHLYFQTTPNGSTTETTRMLISQNGNVGIGTISPTSKLDVRGYGYFGTSTSGINIGQAGYSDIHAIGTGNRLTFNYGRDVATDINFDSDADVTIVTGGTGLLGVGTLSPDAKLTVSGTASKTGGGAWATFSDQRVKTDIKQFNDGLEVLMRLNPVSFKYNEKSGYNDLNKTYIGFIAQEVEKVTPYMVTTFDDSKGPSGLSDKRQFDESALTKIMVNAIQEQQTIINSQQQQIDELTKKLDQLIKIIEEKK